MINWPLRNGLCSFSEDMHVYIYTLYASMAHHIVCHFAAFVMLYSVFS